MRITSLVTAVLFAFAPLAAHAQGIVTQLVSGKRIALAAAAQLASVPRDAEHDLVPVSMVPDQVVCEGHVAIHAGAPTGSPAFVNVPVEIDVDGRADRTVMVGYRMQQFVETAVAARDLVAGTVLSADDLTIARVPFTGLPGNGVDALIGRKVYSAFVKGQPIQIQATAVNQIVQPGSTVEFVVRDNGVAVTADAIARTGGGMGDQVYVYNTLTHKALSGTVTGPGTVELDISGGDQ
ncbi:MAG TPA: flagellar basal body P-ring formation chaperone FlgA [Candidatus Baltobacteraceae bacterium]|jgi:flagella basal body P-ring formation protein FlgA|nr:flagellar basal body P-ring formation chaperone FlgA [Candidatus Baltobacteraceae bacterium]